MFDFPILIGDIGGTNARFSIISDVYARPGQPIIAKVEAYDDVETAIEELIFSKTSRVPKTMILAVAAHGVDGVYQLTNADWTIDANSLIRRFDLSTIVIMNDFSAQALAAVALEDAHLINLGGSEPALLQPKLVVGPGTGLGVANIINAGGKWIVLPGEGGHMDLGPRNAREIEIWAHLKKLNGRMSGEGALSGRGLENLYQAIARLEHAAPAHMAASDITTAALSHSNPHAIEALELFVTLLGRTAGDLALVTMPAGGVYLAGGIVTKITEKLTDGPFRDAFEDKAPHGNIMKMLPVRVINHPTAALEGLAAFAQQPDQFLLQSAVIVHRENNV